MDKQAVEAQLCQLPISQYAWIDPQTIEFSDRIRYVCEHECPMYGTSWACPPAVGTVAACRERILSYPGALVFTTLSEVDDIADLSAALATRAPHEAVTRQVRDILRRFSPDVLTLSTESCAICEHCAYPDAPCRHPERMFPCVESYGIVATALAEQNGIEFYNGNIVTSVLNGSPVGHIISINGNANYNFIRSGIVASLDAAIKQTGIDMTDARYNQTIRQYYHVNGSQYVFGYTTFGDTTRDVSGLWAYNKRIMNAIKVDPYALYQSGDWTWQKVSEIAKAATVRNSSGTVTQYGLGISGAMSVLIQLSLANGGRLGTVDSSGSPKITLDTPNNREAFEQLYQWGSVDKTVLGNADDMAWNAIDKEFAKGNIAILAGGAALVNICYEQGMKDEIGIVPVPKGPRATGYGSQMNIGYGYFIPVTYQKDAAKYLMLMDELYMPYEGVSQDTLFKERWISRFTDANAYKLFKSMYTDTAHQVTDMLSLFDVSWGDPAFSTVAGNVMRGTITPGNAIDTYADTYQTVVNDKFDGYKITGIKNGG